MDYQKMIAEEIATKKAKVIKLRERLEDAIAFGDYDGAEGLEEIIHCLVCDIKALEAEQC